MTKSVLLCIAAGLAWVALMGVILFGCAGRLDLNPSDMTGW